MRVAAAMRVAGLFRLPIRRLWHRRYRFGGIQARMLLLLAVAAIPLVALSGTLAWRDYETARRDVIESAKLTREAAVAERRAALFATEHLLRVLAARTALGTPAFAQADCDAALGTAMSLDPEAYGALLVFDAAGRLACAPAAPPAPAMVAALGRISEGVRPDAAPLIEAFAIDGGPESRLAIAVPITGPAGLAGAVVACVRLDQLINVMHAGLEEGALVWLFGPQAAGPAYAALAGPALPADPRVLNLSRDRGLIARARDGALTSYASQMLSGGLVVLAGYRAEAALAAARHVLISRLAILAALLGIGFLLTGVGIHQYVIRPLKDLAGAVRRWRGGGAFTAALPSGMPSEVAELSLAFSDATVRLAEREAQVRAALEERDLVMQEIHHRVKNNLQIVASLLNLQAGRIRQPEARAEFLSARNRVRALATLHRHLYAHGDLHRINMRNFLTELCGQLFEAMGETEGDRITLSIEASELEMASDQAVPLALIVTETVSNALKYAFPRPRRGHVCVTLTTEDARTARLTVEDDGVGLPVGQSETDTGTRDGLGIQLIRGFARQIGAELTVTENQGTRYSLAVPLHAAETAEAVPAGL